MIPAFAAAEQIHSRDTNKIVAGESGLYRIGRAILTVI